MKTIPNGTTNSVLELIRRDTAVGTRLGSDDINAKALFAEREGKTGAVVGHPISAVGVIENEAVRVLVDDTATRHQGSGCFRNLVGRGAEAPAPVNHSAYIKPRQASVSERTTKGVLQKVKGKLISILRVMSVWALLLCSVIVVVARFFVLMYSSKQAVYEYIVLIAAIWGTVLFNCIGGLYLMALLIFT